MKKDTYVTHSEADTKDLAAEIVGNYTIGRTIALEGKLGAGKTTFVKGIAEALKVEKVVQSPTFVLMNVYPTKYRKIKQLVHVDCYRLESLKELLAIGIEDYLNDPKTLVVIEWAEKIKPLLTGSVTTIRFTMRGESTRSITVASAQ